MIKRTLMAGVVAAGMALPASAAVVDLGFALDESGSVGRSNFNLTRDGLAAALNLIPTSGNVQYRVAVATFNSGSNVDIAPIIVTAANKAQLISDVKDLNYSGGGTSIAAAVSSLTSAFVGTSSGVGDTSLFNIVTDGRSNVTSLQNAVDAASLAGIDGVSYEGIGSGIAVSDLQSACFGGGTYDAATPTTAADCPEVTKDNIPNATESGFVVKVATFADFEAAIKAKVGRIVVDTGGGTPAIPLPAGLPLMLAGLGALGFLRNRKNKA